MRDRDIAFNQPGLIALVRVAFLENLARSPVAAHYYVQHMFPGRWPSAN